MNEKRLIIKGLRFIVIGVICLGFVRCSEQRLNGVQNKKMDELTDYEFGDFQYPEYLKKEFLLGKFDPTVHPDFVLIPDTLRDKKRMYLQQNALNAFLKMYRAMAREGLKVTIRSATRNFDYQKGIWERKWTGITLLNGTIDATKHFPHRTERAKKILTYSSMPGTSRHHWGTDLDINAFNNAYFEEGEGLKIYQWMRLHAAEYGFCQPYTKLDEKRPYGYQEEKWHWSYFPIASILTQAYNSKVQLRDIVGFKGAQAAKDLDVINHYVLGINRECIGLE